MKYSVVLPRIDPADPDAVKQKLERARALWARGDQRDALALVKAAAASAASAGISARATVLEKAALALSRHVDVGGEGAAPPKTSAPSLRLGVPTPAKQAAAPAASQPAAAAQKPASSRPKSRESQKLKATASASPKASATAETHRPRGAGRGSTRMKAAAAAPPVQAPAAPTVPVPSPKRHISDPVLTLDFEGSADWPLDADGDPIAPAVTQPPESLERPTLQPEQDEELVVTVAGEESSLARNAALVGHRAVRVAIGSGRAPSDSLWFRPLAPGEVAPAGTSVALLVALEPGAKALPKTG